MLSFAGVSLSISSAKLRKACEDWWFINRMNYSSHPAYQSSNFMGTFPTPQAQKRIPPELGVLSWPNSASRWATFYYFVTGDQMQQIRNICYATPFGSVNPLGGIDATSGLPSGFLVMDDGNGGFILSSPPFSGFPKGPFMRLLPPRPVFQSGSDPKQWVWLLALVDDRFFWWQRFGTGRYYSNTGWIGLLNSALGFIGINYALPVAIQTDYNQPEGPVWWTLDELHSDRAIPMLADAQIARIGRRVLFAPSDTTFMTCTVQDPATAAPQDAAQWTSFSPQLISGGRLQVGDIAQSVVPYQVSVVFMYIPDIDDFPQRVDVTLTSLSLSAYAGFAGVGGTGGSISNLPNVILSSGMGPRYDLSPTDYMTAITAYATQLATDWYSWQLSLTDATFRGIIPWQPTGFEDRIEWVHPFDKDDPDQSILTRVIRREFSDENLYGTGTQIPLVRISAGQIPQQSLAIAVDDGAGNMIWSYLVAPTSPNPGTQTYTLVCQVTDGVPVVGWV